MHSKNVDSGIKLEELFGYPPLFTNPSDPIVTFLSSLLGKSEKQRPRETYTGDYPPRHRIAVEGEADTEKGSLSDFEYYV